MISAPISIIDLQPENVESIHSDDLFLKLSKYRFKLTEGTITKDYLSQIIKINEISITSPQKNWEDIYLLNSFIYFVFGNLLASKISINSISQEFILSNEDYLSIEFLKSNLELLYNLSLKLDKNPIQSKVYILTDEGYNPEKINWYSDNYIRFPNQGNAVEIIKIDSWDEFKKFKLQDEDSSIQITCHSWLDNDNNLRGIKYNDKYIKIDELGDVIKSICMDNMANAIFLFGCNTSNSDLKSFLKDKVRFLVSSSDSTGMPRIALFNFMFFSLLNLLDDYEKILQISKFICNSIFSDSPTKIRYDLDGLFSLTNFEFQEKH
ncbi:MAG: hypothetical protein HOP11_14420 [Saprospiraceae bacterium]|nr:hypothetical protein [Saprospiraceae bacterium]